MDRKTILVLVASIGALMLWPLLVGRLYPPIKMPISTNTLVTATNQAIAQSNTVTAAMTNLPAVPPITTNLVVAGTPEELLVLENENARYTFTSHGGGLKLVELIKYGESTCGGKTNAASQKNATLNTRAPVPVGSLLGGESIQGDGIFKLAKISPKLLRAEKSFTNGLYLVKDFQLSSNYLVVATVHLENRGSQALFLPAHQFVIGTSTPLGPQDNLQLLGVDWFDGDKLQTADQTYFDNRTLGCIPGTPRDKYLMGNDNVVWASVHNQFFTVAVVPKEKAPQLLATPIDLPPPSKEEQAANTKTVAHPKGHQAALVYPAVKLDPAQKLDRQFLIFAGPKEYQTLAELGAQLNNKLDLVMGYSGFFGFFSKALLLSMNGLHSLLHVGYGWCIILITVIIKVLFWPLTQASTRSMKRMSALQPQMKALQEKFKDDPAKMNRKLMEFMKENKVSPLGGCLPMLLQIPVFFGFYRMIQSAIELRGESFLWVCDLSKSDTLFFLPVLNFPVNPLPLLMGVTMLWQARLTPASPGVDPVQQKMMKYMPLMFLFILYNFSAGLTLYWTVQNLLTIAQMKLTKTGQPAGGHGKAPAPAAPQKRK
jgi:YidC/Oxa1 family membrane protein insertase